MKDFDIDEATSEDPDEDIGACKGAEPDGGATEPVEKEPPFANEGTYITGGFTIHPP